ncbi:chromate transporter [Limnohabitans lacus]|uniref:Chromate transporter n=1 Tax=Limnohabitans lacus TaxID=3045173 RepID=A0ABT6X6E8_9BURK|nr:chromate transporter [Limnohabitans sp. HM2-2]MDI9233584.1 chromate transporter [Limnohabitans sp. HM2-2]
MSEPSLLNRPKSKMDLFLSFTWLALQGFGGVLAVVQRVLVEEKRWMSKEQFVEDWAVAQIMPGPNVVNLSLMIGGRYFGLAGALAGLAGMLTAPLIVVLLLAIAFGGVSDAAWAQGALRGMGAVSAGLIAAVGLKLISALKTNPMGMPVCIGLAVLSFVGVGVMRWPLAWVLLGMGLLGCGWAYVQLARAAAKGAR